MFGQKFPEVGLPSRTECPRLWLTLFTPQSCLSPNQPGFGQLLLSAPKPKGRRVPRGVSRPPRLSPSPGDVLSSSASSSSSSQRQSEAGPIRSSAYSYYDFKGIQSSSYSSGQAANSDRRYSPYGSSNPHYRSSSAVSVDAAQHLVSLAAGPGYGHGQQSVPTSVSYSVPTTPSSWGAQFQGQSGHMSSFDFSNSGSSFYGGSHVGALGFQHNASLSPPEVGVGLGVGLQPVSPASHRQMNDQHFNNYFPNFTESSVRSIHSPSESECRRLDTVQTSPAEGSPLPFPNGLGSEEPRRPSSAPQFDAATTVQGSSSNVLSSPTSLSDHGPSRRSSPSSTAGPTQSEGPPPSQSLESGYFATVMAAQETETSSSDFDLFRHGQAGVTSEHALTASLNVFGLERENTGDKKVLTVVPDLPN